MLQKKTKTRFTNALLVITLLSFSPFLGTKTYGQTPLFRGTVETTEFYTNLKVEVPAFVAGHARIFELPKTEFDTVYRRYTICSDTIITQSFTKSHVLTSKSIQIQDDLYFWTSHLDYYLKFGRVGGGSLLEFEKEEWKKVKQKKLREEYDHYAISRVNKVFQYYIDSEYSVQYDSQLAYQRSFSQVFNSFGTYRKSKEISGEGERIRLYKYHIDPDCDCTVLMQDLKLKDTAEIDPNILPGITTSEKLRPVTERQGLPFFEANDTIGQAFYPSDLLGQVTYIDFWASWCVPCRAEMPYLKTIRDQYAEDAVKIISISLDKNNARLKWLAATEQLQMGWTNWIIPNGFQSELARELEIKGIPRYILLDKKGRVVNENAPRPSDKEAIEKLINELLKEH